MLISLSRSTYQKCKVDYKIQIMKTVLFFIFLIFCLKAGQSLYQGSAFVQELKSSQLSLIRQGIWVVNYYNPKSQASQHFAPEFIKTAKLLKHIAKFAAIDVSSQITDTDIKSYPLVRLYVDGKAISYEKRLRAADIAAFIYTTLPQIISRRVQSADPTNSNSKNQWKAASHTKLLGKSSQLNSNTREVQNKASIFSNKTLRLKHISDFKTAYQIANPPPMGMQVISDRVISEKK